jgi:signal transduction histidine kinase
MRLTPRRRVVLAILVTVPVAYYYLSFAASTSAELYLYYRAGHPDCRWRWAAVFNGCAPSTYSPTLAWTELLVATRVVVLVAYALGRWAVRPFAEIADVLDRFGPASIGLRVGADGPRDEVRGLAEAIDAMLERVAAGYESQRRFASNASHELRTPLATQRALIEISLGSALTREQLDLVARQLLATNERNERLIDGLLTLAESDRGLVSTTTLRWDVIVADAVEAHRRAAAERGITIAAHLAPVTVAGEQPLLERLVANLLDNALKYNTEGGTVGVQLWPDASLVVTNSGPPVPPEQTNALFEPFRRLRGERLDHGGGVGLGLTIVRSIAAAHRGTVAAYANPDGGLTVQVRLPATSG